MLTVHGLFKPQVTQLVYGLLIGQKTSGYDPFFENVLEEVGFRSAINILTGFDSGSIKSLK
jgi:hypothetical protein